MRISDWSSDVCSSDLDLLTYGDRHNCGGLGAHQQFIRLCHVEDGGVAVNFSGILNGVEIHDGCPIVAIPGIRGYIIEQSMVLRSEERREGKECVRTGRTRWWP